MAHKVERALSFLGNKTKSSASLQHMDSTARGCVPRVNGTAVRVHCTLHVWPAPLAGRLADWR